MFEAYKSVVLFISSILFVMYRQKKKHKENETCEQYYKIKSSNPEDDYKKETILFDKLFSGEGTVNMNIDPDMYGESSQERDWGDVENIWKSRILLQNTLQGNVIMYYDMYKMAFVYYSDMQISYKWLNYCAMKYVRIYFCRDFFLDDSFLPPTFENPFNLKKSKEEKEDLQKKEDKKKHMDIDFESEVFLKRKGMSKKIKETPQRNDLAEKCVNNFRYMGKLANYSFLKIPAKVETKTKNYQYIDFKRKLKKQDDAQLQLRNRVR